MTTPYQHTQTTSQIMPLIPSNTHSRMFNYKSMRVERQNRYKFRDGTMEPPKVKVG